jgi:integrase
VKKIPADVRDEIDALSPVELERVLTTLSGRDRAIVQLGGHFGLSPQEIRKVPCSALEGQLLTVGRAQTKASRRRVRVVDGPAVAARELRLWIMESGGRGADPIVGDVSPNAMRLWNRRVLRPAVAEATEGRITDGTATLLRHSHASACHHVATLTEPEILDRLGHGAQVHYLHYAGIIKAIRGERFESLDALIEAARRAQADSVAPKWRPSQR